MNLSGWGRDTRPVLQPHQGGRERKRGESREETIFWTRRKCRPPAGKRKRSGSHRKRRPSSSRVFLKLDRDASLLIFGQFADGPNLTAVSLSFCVFSKTGLDHLKKKTLTWVISPSCWTLPCFITRSLWDGVKPKRSPTVQTVWFSIFRIRAGTWTSHFSALLEIRAPYCFIFLGFFKPPLENYFGKSATTPFFLSEKKTTWILRCSRVPVFCVLVLKKAFVLEFYSFWSGFLG